MEPNYEEDSFEEYKKYLEDSIGVTGVNVPPKIMTPYIRFCFQKKIQQKSNGKKNKSSQSISQQWKNLDPKKKEQHQKIYQIQNRRRQELQQQYNFLNFSKSPSNSYSLFMKEEFQKLLQKYPSSQSNEINKIVAAEWKMLSDADKAKYQKQAKQIQKKYDITPEQSILDFKKQLDQEKEQIIDKCKLMRSNHQKQKKQPKFKGNKKAENEQNSKTKQINKSQNQSKQWNKSKRQRNLQKKQKRQHKKEQRIANYIDLKAKLQLALPPLK